MTKKSNRQCFSCSSSAKYELYEVKEFTKNIELYIRDISRPVRCGISPLKFEMAP